MSVYGAGNLATATYSVAIDLIGAEGPHGLDDLRKVVKRNPLSGLLLVGVDELTVWSDAEHPALLHAVSDPVAANALLREALLHLLELASPLEGIAQRAADGAQREDVLVPKFIPNFLNCCFFCQL